MPFLLLADYGQNTRIRDTLSNLVLKSPQEWQTSVGKHDHKRMNYKPVLI